MSDDAHISDDKRWIRGTAGSLLFTVRGEGRVMLTASVAAGALTVSCKPLRFGLADNSIVYFENPGFAIQLTEAASVGATSLTVAALPGPIPQGAEGSEVLDPTGWAMRWRCESPETDTALITAKTTVIGNITVVNGPQSTLYKVVQVAMVEADTSALTDAQLGSYHHDLYRTDSGYGWKLASGVFELAET